MTDHPSHPGMTHPDPSLAAQVLSHGHAWLRFPAPLERRFQAEALEPRRKLLFICGLIGVVSICLGSVKLAELMPDIVNVAFRNLYWILAASMVGVLSFWLVPPRWRRTWQGELGTAVPLLLLNAGLIYGCMVSRADTTFTHSAALVSSVMYACIAARLRFYWSLGCALLTFAGFLALARPHTPLQELIVQATAALMGVSYVFALAANYAFEHSERRTWLLRQVAAQQHGELAERSEHLRRLSTLDPLTQLYNRRQFEAELAQAWSQARDQQAPVALLTMDVDHFKHYNDRYGHPAGDACLVQVAQILSAVAQHHGGVCARLGGEEFALLLPGCNQAGAMRAGIDLCAQVAQARLPHQASPVAPHVTVSVGAAQLHPAQGGHAAMLEALADNALYRAKRAGRHRCCEALPEDVATVLAGGAKAPSTSHTNNLPVTAARESAPARILKEGFRRLRFPADQEGLYQAQHAVERRKRLEVMAVLGLALNNLYVLGGRHMVSDPLHDMLQWQVGLSALMLLLTAIGHVSNISTFMREALFSLGTSALAISSAWLMSHSPHLSTLSYAVCLALIPMFSGVGARQPFWFTFVPSVVTLLSAATLLKPVGAVQALVFGDSLLMIFTNIVFTLMLAYSLEYGARKEWLLTQIEQAQGQALQALTQNLHQLSMQDPLTGLCNRRQFEEDYQRIWAHSMPEQQPLAMLMIDVDFFKRYNDCHGHPQGDSCLQQVAAQISHMASLHQGLAARLGGEEFAILLPGFQADAALRVGEAMCARMRQAAIPHRDTLVPGLRQVTVSVGSASLVARADANPRELFAQADEALYQAKQSGRNRAAMAAHLQPARASAPA